MGAKHTCICKRKEDGRLSGDSGDAAEFKGFFLSPPILPGGDKSKVVTADDAKGHPFGRPGKSRHSFGQTRQAVSTEVNLLNNSLKTASRNQDLHGTVHKQAPSFPSNIGTRSTNAGVAIKISSIDQTREEVFGRDTQTTRCATQTQTDFVTLRYRHSRPSPVRH